MIKNKFCLDDYCGKYVMCCETDDERYAFCDFLAESGRAWRNGSIYNGNLTESIISNYHPKFFIFNEHTWDSEDCRSLLLDQGYKLINFSDFAWNYIDEQDMESQNSFLKTFNIFDN